MNRPLPRSARRFGRASLLMLAVLPLLPACQGDGATPPEGPAGSGSSFLRGGANGVVAARGSAEGPVLLGVPAEVRAAGRAGSVATLVDERGLPRMLQAAEPQPARPGVLAEVAAREHLARYAAALGLDGSGLAHAVLHSVGPAGEGVRIARFVQRFDDIEVYRAGARLLLRDDLSLTAVSAQLVSGRTPRGRAQRDFRLPASEAVAATLGLLFDVAVAPRPLIEAEPDDEYQRFVIGDADPLLLGEPARVRKVWFQAPEGLRAAWMVELYAARPDEEMRAYRLVLDAADASLLERRDLTLSDAFTFRVWAEASGDKRPLDSPLTDMTPHPTGMPSGFKPQTVPPQLVTMEGFNKNPMGGSDPWLPPGAMVTQGNNVDAYSDRGNTNRPAAPNFFASVTAPGVFDRTYDLNAQPAPSNDQAMASTVNLFYLTNWLHDYWYDSGFDEKAGNGQRDNFGRGGMGKDNLNCEVQDAYDRGQRDNANMSTPGDGMSPRMQVFVWNTGDTRTLTLTPGGNVASDFADFGPTDYDVTADVVLVNDGNGTTTDACSPLMNGADVKGKIALIDRGNCNFQPKVTTAQMAGAVGVILANNMGNNGTVHLTRTNGAADPAIPAMGISRNDGVNLKTALMMGAVKARLQRKSTPLADAALDNTVTAHEWGHYLHQRLADCSLQQCAAMSEGWGDFSALFLVTRSGDSLDGAFPMAPYAARGQGDSYYGLRRMPYSVDMGKNGLTFKHISNGQALPSVPRRMTGGGNAEVHNAGEVWASMMWESYVALLKDGLAKGATFDAVRRKMADYVVGGLQLAPTDATYLEQRDAILAAVFARNKDDVPVVANAFARRGAGSCAKGPARDSRDFVGVTESYEVKGRIDIRDVSLDDTVDSCDKDGVLDAGESGHLTVTLANGGPIPLTGIKLTVVSNTPGLTVVGSNVVMVADIASLQSTTAQLTLKLDPGVMKMTGLDLDVRVEAANACEPMVTRKIVWRGNYDEVPESSRTDDVEAAMSAWTPDGETSGSIWTRAETGPLKHAWHGIDWGSPSDTSLVSPDLAVSATDNFTFAFDHKYAFEEGDAMGAHHFYDGAILELSDDGGNSWHDVAGWQQPGYTGPITNISGNALADRSAFVGQSKSWPAYDHLALDFGKSFAGKTLKVRFRISTDQAAGNYGWEIDNIAFGGITNTPFTSVVDNRMRCTKVATLVANAGPDQRSTNGQTVTLDATASTGGGGPLSFKWAQTTGATVTLSDPSQAKPTFAVPDGIPTDALTFEVTVTDGVQTARDSVVVTVLPPLSDGCCRVAGAAPARGLDVGPALGLLLLYLWPRRRKVTIPG